MFMKSSGFQLIAACEMYEHHHVAVALKLVKLSEYGV